MTVARAPRTTAEFLFQGPYGLRAGWRLALYALLFVVVTRVLAVAVAAAGMSQSMLATTSAPLFGALVAGWVMVRVVDQRPVGALGFAAEPAGLKDSAVGTLAGGAMLGAAVVLLAVAGTARWVAEPGTVSEYVAALGRALLFFWVAAALEEVLFRGYPFQVLVQGIGVWPTLLVTSALFTYVHGRNPNVTALALANIFLAGFMLGVAYLRTRSLWFATAVHMGWNWAMSGLLDFPVSGFRPYDAPYYDAHEIGADWWTGGAFGPEAGVAATITLALGTAWLMRTRRIGESARMRELRPLVNARIGEGWR
ncbi:MAG TPA: CPBP family intramembrane glutamic endopeptidase [Longimicrobium sp.]